MRVYLLLPGRAKEIGVHSGGDVKDLVDLVLVSHLLAVFDRYGNNRIKSLADLLLEFNHLSPLSSEVAFLNRVVLNFKVSLPDHRFNVMLKQNSRTRQR